MCGQAAGTRPPTDGASYARLRAGFDCDWRCIQEGLATMDAAHLLTGNSTGIALAQGLAGIAAMGLMFLAPGYLWAWITGVAGFRERSREERLLWSVALSVPLAIAICALAGRVLSSTAVVWVFLLLDGCAVVVAWRSRAKAHAAVPRTTWWLLGLMGLFGVYCIAAVTDIQLGHRLYVSTVISDWSVRVAMVKAAMHSGVPPINGLSTLGVDGHAPHLRYYYFWYVVVAQMARAMHLRAHAALAASCVWAGWGLIAAFFLALKYMAGIQTRLRAKCFVGLLVGAVLGLDILPTALLWISPRLHPYAEMEWWHQDRTPSFLSSVLYAPHHMAAFCSLLVGFLVLLLTVRDDGGRSWKSLIGAGLFAGVAFAAAAGTSLFPTFCFVFVLGLWAVDLMRRRQWLTVAALAAAGVLALALAHGYLQELSSGSSAASGFVNLAWRNDSFIAAQQVRHHLLTGHGPILAALARQPMVLVMDFFDLGFYLLVLVHRARHDLLRPGRLTLGQSAVWALVLGAAVPCFFLTSTATSGPNDLGVDAGFLLRLGLQVWAVSWVWQLWEQRREPKPVVRRIGVVVAAVLFCLGLSAEAYQVVSERLYYAVVGSGRVHKQMDSFTQDRMAQRMYNIRQAMMAFDAMVPPSAPDSEAVEFNPIGVMLPAETIYNDHQLAAWDGGCGTSYGGDYKACAPVYASLLQLFGNTQAGVVAGRAENDRQDGAAVRVANGADFAAVCERLKVRAIVAESTDAIWAKTGSWVWTEQPMVANETVRVMACPAAQGLTER